MSTFFVGDTVRVISENALLFNKTGQVTNINGKQYAVEIEGMPYFYREESLELVTKINQPSLQQRLPLKFASITIPDSIDISALSPAEKASVAHYLKDKITQAHKQLADLLEGVQATVTQAENDVYEAIKQSGGSALPHEHLEIKLEQRYESVKQIDELRTGLYEALPYGEYREAVFCKKYTIKSSLSDDILRQLHKMLGGIEIESHWDADGTKLNSLLKKYGENSNVGKIIKKAYYKVPSGNPKLVIRELAEEKAITS